MLGISQGGLRAGIPVKWFNDGSTALNRVLPSFYHDYINNRYYNIIDGETSFPFPNIRAGNAMQFDSLGRLVWAPANALTRSDPSTAVVGSPGVAPIGWGVTLGTSNGVTRSIVAQGVQNGIPYMDVRWVGTFTAIENITVTPAPGALTIAASPTESWTGSVWWAVVDGTLQDTFTPLLGGTRIRYGSPGLLAQTGSRNTAQTQFVRDTNSLVAPALTTVVGTDWVWSFNAGAVVDFTVRIGAMQLERTGPDSPKAYNVTTGMAYFGPRFDYDPQTLQPRGLLVEPVATNLNQRSDTSLPSDWNNGSFCTATYPGDIWNRPISRITVSATGAAQFNYINSATILPLASTVHSASVFVKRGNIARVQFTTSGNFTDAYMNYNFDTNTITLGGTNAIAGSGHAQLLQSGWVRIQYSFTTIASPVTGAGGIIAFIDTDGAVRLGSTTTNGAFVDCFGFQFEANGLATSYIPTAGATATRAVDSTLLTPLPWLTQNKGTIYMDLTSNKFDANSRRYLSMDDNTANNRIQISRGGPGNYVGISSVVGASDFAPATAATINFTRDKVALRYNSAGKAIVAEGTAVGSNAVAPPVAGYTHLTIGNIGGFTPGNAPCGWIRELRYYADDSATNAQLQTLTT